MKQYSIGDFAKYLGVTPDFLKYYETKGILKPTVKESGYRYYHFWERGQVLECMKLRNCGFTSKEVVSLLNAASMEEYLAKLLHMQAQAEAFDRLDRIASYFASENNWEIAYQESFYFLPHSAFDTFLDTPEIHAAVENWLEWMPVVHSTIRYPYFDTSSEERTQPMVGFSVSARFAEKNGLFREAPVELVPAQRWFILYLKDKSQRPYKRSSEEDTAAQTRRQYRLDTADAIMREHRFTPRADGFYITKLLQPREQDTQTNYSIMQIPID